MPNLSRIFTRVLFLAFALFLGLVFWYLPNFLELDTFRPQAIALLQNTFHCRIQIGHIRGELLPYPGLIITQVALLDEHSPHVLGSVRVAHLFVSPSALAHGQWQFPTLRLVRPRFIRHREPVPGGMTWVGLAFDVSGSSPSATPLPPAAASETVVDRIEIRNGSSEIWDHTQHPAARWTADQFNGSYDVRQQVGAVTGRALALGPHTVINVRYSASDPYPLVVRVDSMNLAAVQQMVHQHWPLFNGTASVVVKARISPAVAARVTLTSLQLDRLPDNPVRGTFSWEDDDTWRAHLITGNRLPMTLAVEGRVLKDGWVARATVNRYNSRLVQKLYDQPWLNRLAGRGTVTLTAANSGQTAWSWQANGKDFDFDNSPFEVPYWSAQGDPRTVSVNVHGVAADGGTTDVSWVKPLQAAAPSTLSVNVSSVTVRQVLTVFALESTSAPVAGRWNPYGYEAWRMADGTLEALIDSETFHVQNSQFDLAGMGVGLKGDFSLTRGSSPAKIQGYLQDVPVEDIVESFFPASSHVSGTAQVNFTLAFPLSREWLRGLTGPLELHILDGVIREFKTFYRITSVLNLTNYFRLRLPQVTAQGILFDTLSGHLAAQQGVLSTDDLFLKSPNFNMGAKGSVDLVGQRLDVTLRLEILRFIDEVLKVVPITHWIFKKPNKILFPLVVSVKGPWNDVDVH